MRTRAIAIVALAALLAGTAACYRPYGYHYYPDTPRFAPTDPARVVLTRRGRLMANEVSLRLR